MDLNVLLRYKKLFPMSDLNILLSYGLCNATYPDFLIKHRDMIGSCMLDSGTWSLNKSERSTEEMISAQSYERYVMAHGNLFSYYLNFDSDFSVQGFGTNLEHQLKLEKAGLKPIPVIHNVLEGEEFDYYLKNRTKYPYVAVGSNQKGKVKTLRHFIQTYYDNDIKVHILGTTRYDLIANIPVYSCDASNWAKIGAYGYVKWWNPSKTTPDKTDRIYLDERIQLGKRKDSYSAHKYKIEFDVYLNRTFGLSYADLIDNAQNKQLVNLHYCVELEREVNYIHIKNEWHLTSSFHA